MRREGPRLSVRQEASMAGAIFMSNTVTRELCFHNNIFGLPLEYQTFVENVKEGMPLFLFDHTERRLYGVFLAAADGGLDINRSAFQSIGRTYPAQVCFRIVWKCRPLAEDEFSLAIKENYYAPKKFYFDLSYQQVVRLYELFDEKRVERPICNISKNSKLDSGHFRKCTPDKRSLSPKFPPFPADQADILISSNAPNISTVEANYYASTSTNQPVPQSNAPMPWQTNTFGAQVTPIHSSYHDQSKLPYYDNSNVPFPVASTVDAISTQVYASCSQTIKCHRDPNQSYPLPQEYPDKCLYSGCRTWDPTDGLQLSAGHSYSSPPANACNFLPSTGYKTQYTAGEDRNYVSSTVTEHAPSYPHFAPANLQGNSNRQDHFDVNCYQCRLGSNEENYAPGHQHLSKVEALTPPQLIQQGVLVYPEIPESVIDQWKESFTDEDFENEKSKHGFNRNASGPSALGIDNRDYMPEQQYQNHDIRSECNTTDPVQRPQNDVFSRLSVNLRRPSQEISGPSLNQLVHSLSQRTQQWSKRDKIVNDDVCKQLVSDNEQVVDIPCPFAELQHPSLVEEEYIEPPLVNFKRRSEAGKLDANRDKEISGKVKRRKLVRPSFGEDNSATSSGKELQANSVEVMKHSHAEVGGNKLDIDLNRPAPVDGDLVEEEGSIVFCPALAIKIQTEKPCEANTSETNCSNTSMSDNDTHTGTRSKNTAEAINKQDPSLDNDTHTGKVSLDLNVADLHTMDKAKLQAILGSSLLQALDKFRNGKPHNSEEARSIIYRNDMKVNISMNSDGDAKPTCS